MTAASPTVPPSWRDVADRVAKARNADVLFYSGGIYLSVDDDLIDLVSNGRSRPNVVLMLTTLGGDPDAAYRMARCLREEYKGGEFILFIDSICKSAGTLIALGAHRIVMSDRAELGPLDVQVYKPDEVGEMASGLTPIQALTTLRAETFKLWEDSFKKLRYRHAFSTRMAALIAAKMSIGLFRPIYEQIDPMRLGENERAMMIGWHYGHRLKTDNLKDNAIDSLLVGYPSHSFVIDRTEAHNLFCNVEKSGVEEQALADAVADLVKTGQESDARLRGGKLLYLSGKLVSKVDSKANGETNDNGSRKTRTAAAGARSNLGSTSGNGRSESNGSGAATSAKSGTASDRPTRQRRRARRKTTVPVKD